MGVNSGVDGPVERNDNDGEIALLLHCENALAGENVTRGAAGGGVTGCVTGAYGLGCC